MKLIFLDIDGTLTEPGCMIPPDSAVQAIRKTREKGNRVFLCTGRNRGMASPLMQYGMDGMVALAGGLVTFGEEVLFDCPMDGDLFRKTLDLLHEDGVFCTVECRDDSFCDPDIGILIDQAGRGNSELERWRKMINESLNIRPLSEYEGQPVYKIVVMFTDHAQIRRAQQLVGDRFDFVMQQDVQGVHNGELINRAYDKGRGILRVAERLGVPVSDTYGFGDSMNDLAMIETVGTGVCMANGDPRLKKESDLVCPAVTEDGLQEAFRELGLI